MRSAYLKNIIRTFKESKGRFFAILAIVMLGVGFFAGLKVTKATMVGTADKYYNRHYFYDYRLLSSYGFTKDEVDEIEERLGKTLSGKVDEEENDASLSEKTNSNEVDSIQEKDSEDVYDVRVEGSYYEDIVYLNKKGDTDILRAYSVPEKINTLCLREGRLPEAPDECLLDADKYDRKYLDEKIRIDELNSEETAGCFAYDEYTVVGLVDTPLYLSGERGTTTIGNGRISAVMFIPEDGFIFDYYKEAYVLVQNGMTIYSDEYKTLINDAVDKVKSVLGDVADKRYKEMLDSLFLRPIMEDSVPKPETYVLDRNYNTGYAGYKSDTSIVRDIAKIFPVFFFLIAALVCSTTMTRMIDDERGQIGTFRAMGYSNTAILFKYLLYSGSAGLIGSVSGFFIGCRVFPYVIARAYTMLYDYGEPTIYYISPGLLLVCVIASLICTMGTTFFACRAELRGMPAELIRPKAPAAGKRIFLEYVKPLWKHMKFLHKVTARNIFRFKKRMFMMIIGIAGCTALVLTGFGVKDSVSNIANFQFEDIDVYDISVIFKNGIDDNVRKEFDEAVEKAFEDGNHEQSTHIELYQTTVDINMKDAVKNVYLIAAEGAELTGYIELNMIKGNDYPGRGEVILSEKIAKLTEKKPGDEVTFTLSDGSEVTLKVSGIFENYVWHYAFITPETYSEFFGSEYTPNAIYVSTSSDEDAYALGATLGEIPEVVSMNVVPELKQRVDKMMIMLNAVVWVVIGSAGALAFIVLINLSNINIIERKREIATIKVLGFYSVETGSYVFRENFILTLMGIIAGLPLGVLLHSFVISQIKVDMVSFKTVILGRSYAFSVIAVIGFAVAVDLLMRRKLERIDMAESMKAVE